MDALIAMDPVRVVHENLPIFQCHLRWFIYSIF